MDPRSRFLRRARTVYRSLPSGAPPFDSAATRRQSIVATVAHGLLTPELASRLVASHKRLTRCTESQTLIELARDALGDADSLLAAANLIARLHEELASPTGVGLHYTPRAVAHYMAESAVAEYIAMTCGVDREPAMMLAQGNADPAITARTARRIIEQIRDLRICDPACGAGHLLLAVAACLQRIASCLLHTAGASADERATIRRTIACHLHGSDIDADAVAIAKVRLALWANAEPFRDVNNLIESNIVERNGLALADGDETQHDRFDIVIMNPPYVPTYSRRACRDLRESVRQFANARHHSGRLNLFGCFIIRALELAKEAGVVSLIVPDTFASANAYADLRRRCDERFPGQSWARIDDRLFRAQVGSVILTCSRHTQQRRGASLEFSRDGGAHAATPLVLDTGPDRQVLFFNDRHDHDIWRRVRDAADATLGDFATIRDGVNTGPRRIRDLLLDPAAPSVLGRPLIEGSDIDPRGYQLHPPARTILYDPRLVDDTARAAGASLRDPAIFDAPKVVSRQTADTIIAALEPDGGIVALNSVHCICLPAADRQRLPGLTAFLNAPLVRLYYALDGGEQRSVLPQVRIAWLKSLPTPHDFPQLLDRLCLLVSGRTLVRTLASPSADLLERIHREVCRAYGFSEGESITILGSYHRRFPRFQAATSRRRRRSARVA